MMFCVDYILSPRCNYTDMDIAEIQLSIAVKLKLFCVLGSTRHLVGSCICWMVQWVTSAQKCN